MTMVPFWGLTASAADRDCLRKDLEIYRFLLREGLPAAGHTCSIQAW